jgi:hypothetical protein
LVTQTKKRVKKKMGDEIEKASRMEATLVVFHLSTGQENKGLLGRQKENGALYAEIDKNSSL